MAEMKHAKKPERRAPERRPREPKRPRQSAPREPRPAIGRSRVFKAALAREYGVTQLPESLKLRTEKTLSTLPDVMPSKPRPILRLFRGMATAAAALAVTSVILLGLNSTNPQLTESMPGLGPMFAAMNERPTPQPTAVPTPQPEFNPVTVLSKGDFDGVLIIDDAWSDGKSLLLDMSISPGDSFYNVCDKFGLDASPSLSLGTMLQNEYGENYRENNASLLVDYGGGYIELGPDAFAPVFKTDSSGRLTARWQAELDGDIEAGDELTVTLSVPDLTTIAEFDSFPIYSWASNFETTFTLPVSTSKNRVFSLQASDGPVRLHSVDYSPTKVSLDVSLPFLGMVGDLIPDRGESSGWPLGFYAQLSCTDSSGEKFIYSPSADYMSSRNISDPGLSELSEMSYTFTTIDEATDPRELRSPLVLTFYEFPLEPGDGQPLGRVTAEFTIDLYTGMAYPSENYLENGFEKGDASKTTVDRLEEASYNGLLLMPMGNWPEAINSGYDPFAAFTLSAPAEASGRELAVQCYFNGTVVHSFIFVLGENNEWEDGTVYTNYFTLPGAGLEYLQANVNIFYPDELANTYGYVLFDRLELIDPFSGEVIIPDLKAAWEDIYIKLLGAKPYSSGIAANDSENDVSSSSPPL